MARQIRPGPDGDDALSKIAKVIPGEVTAAYLAINNCIGSDPNWKQAIVWGPALFLFIMCPILLWRVQKVRNLLQIAATTVLFPIWVVNISPTRFGLDELTGAVVLILATVVLPAVIPAGAPPADAAVGGGN
jgi:hypothetical protein